MATAGHRRGPGRGPGVNKDREPKRGISPSAERGRQAEIDRWRGSPEEILRARDPQEIPCVDESLLPMPDSGDEGAEDLSQSASEISFEDDDAFDDPGDAPPDPNDTAPDSPAATRPELRIVIPVVHGKAIFQEPDWALGIHHEELESRWQVHQRLADWLNSHRQDFLRSPSYLTLAGVPDSLVPPLIVEREGLALALECEKSTLSKYADFCWLVWPSREIRLDQFWSVEAKYAWFAQAVIHRQKTRGYIHSSKEMGNPNLQPPRDKDDRARVAAKAKNGWSLTPTEFIHLLCVLTSCSWRNVLDRYRRQIFYNE